MELVKERAFPVSCDNHNEILEKVDLVQGHLGVILYTIQGLIEDTGGDIGYLKALASVSDNAMDSLNELRIKIRELRP